jgi:hypothetical protein
MEWVGLKNFGVVSESQKRFRTAADAASRGATKKHVDTCRNGRTPSGGSGWHTAAPFYNLGLVSTQWNRWLGKVSDLSRIANGGSEQHCMLHQRGIPGSMWTHVECQGRNTKEHVDTCRASKEDTTKCVDTHGTSRGGTKKHVDTCRMSREDTKEHVDTCGTAMENTEKHTDTHGSSRE